MTIDLATAYLRTGITVSPTEDIRLMGNINVTLAVVENYLDRKFLYDSEKDIFRHTHGRTLKLRRYPVDAVIKTSVSIGKHQVHYELGTIQLHGQRIIEQVEVEYTGGYKVLPADLEFALWAVFDQFNAQVAGSTGLAAGAIESVTVSDVGTVRFAGGATDSGSAGGVSAIPEMALSLLQPYRRPNV